MEKKFKRQTHQQNLNTIKQNKHLLSEYVDKTIDQIKQEIRLYLMEISEGGIQNQEQYTQMVMDIKQIFGENRLQIREQTKSISSIFHKEIVTFTQQFSRHTKQQNTKLLQQILEQISKQTSQQISEFLEKISQQNNRHNSIFIKQNTDLIREILSQSVQNHGTIDKKFENFVTYQRLVEFRENLITIKNNIMILERLDNTQLKIFHNLYQRYEKGSSSLPSLDITQGIIIIKILLPPFFREMTKKLSLLESEFEDKYTEMTDTIQSSNHLFMNFEKNKLDNIKKMLDSDISTVDEQLVKMIDLK